MFLKNLFKNLKILGRNWLIYNYEGLRKVSRFECLMTIWNLNYIWTDPLAGVMLFIISLDRLIMVVFPKKQVYSLL